MIYLDEENLIEMARDLLEPQEVVIRDLGLLSMSAHRPQTVAFGYEPYVTVGQKAAALLVAICMNHPLQDGNKRLAFAAAWAFTGMNGDRRPMMSQKEATDLVMGVARGELDVPEVAEIFKAHGVE